MKKFKRFLPIIIIVAAMAVIYFTGAYHALTYENLKFHHMELLEYVNDHPILTPFMFMGTYLVATSLSIPGGLFLSLIGGFLFPQPFCTIYVLIGATIGATCLFLAARTALGDALKKKAGPWLSKMEGGFNKNAASYMLFLRLVPVFPFWLVNLAPAFFNVRLRTYIWTTFVGILPGAFVFTQAGRGLSAIFESSEDFHIGLILNTQVKIALICLAVFALIPIIIKKVRERRQKKQDQNPQDKPPENKDDR
ncbi:MAG: hypothetical protein K1000chlam2_00700 [Chlamydiae bacterium]|nr:hypothetical protein [Chlamydiota bacterium]